MRRTFLIALTAVALASAAAATRAGAALKAKDDEKAVAAVRAVLDAQVAAWNRGDIEGFMEGYWRSPETIFVSGDTVTRGWQTVLDRYKRGYDTREKMGTLSFTEMEIKLINKDTAIALGRWQLTRAGDTPKGRFTLILRRKPEGWRVVHDHTSSAS